MLLRAIAEHYHKTDEFAPVKNAIAGASVEGIAPASVGFLVSSIFLNDPRPSLVVTRHYQKMHDLSLDLSSFLEPEKISILPSWEVLPYEYAHPSEKIEAERISAIYRLIKEECCITITTLESLLRAMPGKDREVGRGFDMAKVEECPFEYLIDL